ncbi:uncharacterized protein LOC106082057 [Stomoxys calcitrans]|uniref:Haemolymph juvenile hormone binding protein n=1 Tax=Stomoxys calcitrans TaxID=35570 RepID=A0A1I8P3A7_STOCA|nr:uncharacterized protein LOC106082057 [Stomoxys calcitrans]
MHMCILQPFLVIMALIGSSRAAIASVPNTQEFATSTSSQLNVDGLLSFPSDLAAGAASTPDHALRQSSATNGPQITPCSLSDPNKNECIRGLISSILPQLKNDLPEYGMSSLDPYFYTRGIFRYANDGIQGGLLIKNMQIHGISNLKVNSFIGNFTENNLIVKMGMEIKQLRADGQFKADVKFGGLRLVPKGPFNITIDNIRAVALTDGKLLNNESGMRLQLQRLNANVAVGNAKIVANGIFSDRNLNTMILNLVNENLPEITRVGIPATREQWAPILVEHINNFFAKVPLEKFLIP